MSTKTLRIIDLPIGKIKLQAKNELGVDNIKQSFTEVIVLADRIKNLVKDFSYRKALALAFDLAEYKLKVDIFKMALAEFKDGISVEESQQLADHFGEKFDIENDQLEAIIEEGIDLIPRTYQIVKEVVLLGLDWTGFYKKLQPLLKNEKDLNIAV